jgi:hypothetical protein
VALLLVAGVSMLASRSGASPTSSSSSGGGKVKYIHVITPNTSCEGLNTQHQSSAGTTPTTTTSSSALLQHILPLTNFSGLSTAALIDSAAAANLPVAKLQPLMQLHQSLWCRCAGGVHSLGCS